KNFIPFTVLSKLINCQVKTGTYQPPPFRVTLHVRGKSFFPVVFYVAPSPPPRILPAWSKNTAPILENAPRILHPVAALRDGRPVLTATDRLRLRDSATCKKIIARPP